VLITAHRRESFVGPLQEICLAIRDLARAFTAEGVHFVYPVHLNPNVRKTIMTKLSSRANISLIDPIDYIDMIYLMRRAYFIITDSGGIQEEAPSLGKPVLVTRNTTERPEAVLTGNVKVVGMDADVIYHEAVALLDNSDVYSRRAHPVFPYGDGKASERIIRVLVERFALEPRGRKSL
jgi:UDP-N-acetylglucosamine 2-epimerase